MSVCEWEGVYCAGGYVYPYGPAPLPVETYVLDTQPAWDRFLYKTTWEEEMAAQAIDPLSLVSPAWRPLDDELDVLLPYEPPVAVPALYTTWAPLPSPLAVREASAVSEPYVLVLLLVGLVLAGWRRR